MKFLKKSQINFRNVKDNSIAIQIDGEITLDTTNVVLLPKGDIADRPVSPTVGHLRYNTETNELEVYQGIGGRAAWRSIGYKESNNIIQQDLGAGDEVERFFGPLIPSPPEPNLVDDKGTWGGQNLLVFVENVVQLHGINYEILQNPCIAVSTVISFNANTITSADANIVNFNTRGFYPGQEIVISGGTSNSGTYTIVTVDPTTITVSTTFTTENAGVEITIIGNSSNTGMHASAPYPAGYYIKFDEPVPIGTVDAKKVTVLHGFDR